MSFAGRAALSGQILQNASTGGPVFSLIGPDNVIPEPLGVNDASLRFIQGQAPVAPGVAPEWEGVGLRVRSHEDPEGNTNSAPMLMYIGDDGEIPFRVSTSGLYLQTNECTVYGRPNAVADDAVYTTPYRVIDFVADASNLEASSQTDVGWGPSIGFQASPGEGALVKYPLASIEATTSYESISFQGREGVLKFCVYQGDDFGGPAAEVCGAELVAGTNAAGSTFQNKITFVVNQDLRVEGDSNLGPITSADSADPSCTWVTQRTIVGNRISAAGGAPVPIYESKLTCAPNTPGSVPGGSLATHGLHGGFGDPGSPREVFYSTPQMRYTSDPWTGVSILAPASGLLSPSGFADVNGLPSGLPAGYSNSVFLIVNEKPVLAAMEDGIVQSGHLCFKDDGAYDIGMSRGIAANTRDNVTAGNGSGVLYPEGTLLRPRNIYAAGSVFASGGFVGPNGPISSTYTTIDVTAASTTVDSSEIFVAVSGIGLMTVLMPLAPVDGEYHHIKDARGIAASSGITIDGNGFLIDGDPTVPLVSDYQSLSLVFKASMASWFLI